MIYNTWVKDEKNNSAYAALQTPFEVTVYVLPAMKEGQYSLSILFADCEHLETFYAQNLTNAVAKAHLLVGEFFLSCGETSNGVNYEVQKL